MGYYLAQQELDQQHISFFTDGERTQFLDMINRELQTRIVERRRKWVENSGRWLFSPAPGTDDLSLPDFEEVLVRLSTGRKRFEIAPYIEKRLLLMELIDHRLEIVGCQIDKDEMFSNFLGRMLPLDVYQEMKEYTPSTLGLGVRWRTAVWKAGFSTLAELLLATQEELDFIGAPETVIEQLKGEVADLTK